MTLNQLNGLFLIQIKGKAARLPSMSNNKRAFVNRYTGKAVVVHKKEHKDRLNELSNLYYQAALSRFGLTPVITGLVTIVVILQNYKCRYDSHNYSKTVGDWLQAIELIQDDQHAEILCMKAHEHKPWVSLSDTTTIAIFKRENSPKFQEAINEKFKEYNIDITRLD